MSRHPPAGKDDRDVRPRRSQAVPQPHRQRQNESPMNPQQQGQQQQWQRQQWQRRQQYEQQMTPRLHGLSQPLSGPSNHWTMQADAMSQRLDLLINDVMETRVGSSGILMSVLKERDSLCTTYASLQTHCDEIMRELEVKAEENERLKREAEDLKSRLSEMASKVMKLNNPFVEDLSDPNRPTAIKDRWDAFFTTGQYWTTSSNMQEKTKLEDDTIKMLNTLCQLVYTTCSVYVSHEVQKATEHVTQTEPLSESTPRQTLPKAPGIIRRQIPRSLYNGEHPQELEERCLQNARHADLDVKVDHIAGFVHDLVDICFRMQTQEIPLVLDFSSCPGSPFDGSLYKTEDDSKPPGPDAVIKLVLYPPLLRGAGGPVLSKGLAMVGKTHQEAWKRDFLCRGLGDLGKPSAFTTWILGVP